MPVARQHTLIRLVGLCAASILLLAGCGGDDDGDATVDPGDDAAASDDSGDADPSGDAADADPAADTEDPGDSVEELVEDLEDTQSAQGGGSASLVVGDQEWTRDSVVCAIGEEETGQEGAELVLSSIVDGTQMYATIDSFGHSVSLDDFENFENPSVSVESVGDGFSTVDGTNRPATAVFRDNTSDSFDTIPGTFTATCP